MGSNINHKRDVTVDNNNKTILTVASQKTIAIKHVSASFVTTLTVGLRILTLRVQDENNNTIAEFRSSASQSVGDTVRYSYVPGAARDDTILSQSVNVTIPAGYFLMPGHVLSILDVNDIDSDDDILYDIIYKQTGHHQV